MTPLTREDITKLDEMSAKRELAKYVELFKTKAAVVAKLEERVKDLADKVEIGKQQAFLTREQIEAMKKKLFGDSSEKRGGQSPGPLFEKAEGSEYETVKGHQRKKRTKFGRRAQPDLPRVEVTVALSEEEMRAEKLKPWEGQFETSETITVIPTKIIVEVLKRQKYLATKERDPELPRIVTTPMPVTAIKTKEGSRYSLEFDVEVALAKYLWHLPLDRQVRMMAAQGLEIDTQTLFARIDTLAWYLEAQVMPRLIKEIMAQRVKLADETTWKNLGKRTRDAKKKRFYLWAVRAGRAVSFAVFDGRSGKIAKSFLSGITGVLVVDGYKGYNVMAGPNLIVARDWVHGRRKFLAAETSEREIATWFITKIDRLFRLERKLKSKPLDFVKRARDRIARPRVEQIKARLLELSPKTLPRSALGKAIDYMLTYWQGLTVFLEHPDVPLHTNSIESVIRGPVIGRKNHYGSKSVKTGAVAAVFYSIVETCKANGVDPRRYLLTAMRAILTEQPVPMPWDLIEGTVSKTADYKTVPRLIVNLLEKAPFALSESVS